MITPGMLVRPKQPIIAHLWTGYTYAYDTLACQSRPRMVSEAQWRTDGSCSLGSKRWSSSSRTLSLGCCNRTSSLANISGTLGTTP